MNLFGYTVDSSLLDHHPDFDSYAAPFFHKGSNTGCIVLHGIGGTPANVYVISKLLADCGYTVDAPLLPGHGTCIRDLQKSTYRDWIDTAEASYAKLEAEGCTEIIPIGLSLGGLLAAYLACHHPVKSLVCISAPFRMKLYLRLSSHFSFLFPYVSYGEKDLLRIRKRAPYSQMYYGFSSEKLKDIRKLSSGIRRDLPKITCPVLAIWAKYDNKVDIKSSDILHKHLNNAILTEMTMQNSPHGSTYAKEKDTVAAIVHSFIENPDTEDFFK